MKTLKSLLEGLLSDIDDTIESGEDVVNAVLYKELVSKIHRFSNSGGAVFVDDDCYNQIINFCTEVDSKKGSVWVLVLPNENGSFKPIAANIKKKLYRHPEIKDYLYRTPSAQQKEELRIADVYKTGKLQADFVHVTTPWKFVYFASDYTFNKNANTNSEGWNTQYVSTFGEYINNNKERYFPISVNPYTKEWTFGAVKPLPPNISLENWIKLSAIITTNIRKYKLNHNFRGSTYTCSLSFNTKYIQSLLSTNVINDVKDIVSSPRKWLKVRFTDEAGLGLTDVNCNRYFYINKTNFTVVLDVDHKKYKNT